MTCFIILTFIVTLSTKLRFMEKICASISFALIWPIMTIMYCVYSAGKLLKTHNYNTFLEFIAFIWPLLIFISIIGTIFYCCIMP